MRFRSIIGFLDVDVITIDRIEKLHSQSKPSAIYINKRLGFVIGWNTENWFLWEMPKNGEEIFEQTSERDDEEQQDITKPDNLVIPISITSRYQWDNFVPSVNLFVHELKDEIGLEEYIRGNLQILVGKQKVKFVESGTGLAPNEYVGFSTLYSESGGRKIYQIQKFVKTGRKIYTLSASNIFEGIPAKVKEEIADILNSFALVGKPENVSTGTMGGFKGMLKYLSSILPKKKN